MITNLLHTSTLLSTMHRLIQRCLVPLRATVARSFSARPSPSAGRAGASLLAMAGLLALGATDKNAFADANTDYKVFFNEKIIFYLRESCMLTVHLHCVPCR